MASKRTIIVTGCSSGIGAASAALLKQGGDTIVGVDINDPATGSVDHFVYMDQSDSGSIEKAPVCRPRNDFHPHTFSKSISTDFVNLQ
jgi:NAD(P)-dependent dehydrogenase (short-subunit alcohol dehydrogenase family)